MLYLGIDGGGTKTAFLLISETGKVLAYSTKSTCHYLQVGIDNFKKVLDIGIGEVLKKAGKKKYQLDYTFLGIPAYGEIIKDVSLLEELTSEVLGSQKFRCGNDVEAGWAGSLACQTGLNIVAGTGAIGFGRDQDGNTARTSGWGHFCGDEGSAYWLAKQAISIFGKEADGRLEKSPLYDIIKHEFDLKRDFDLITLIYKKLGRKRDKVAQLAKLIYKAAQQGDNKAIALYRQAAYEYSLIVKALIKKLNYADNQEILTSYSGGVFKAGAYILEPFKKYIKQYNIKLIKPILQPVTGAALYALLLGMEINQHSKNEIIKKIKNEEKRLRI